MAFPHGELMPVMEPAFAPSWGYQVSGYVAPTARYGSPDDFRFMVDYLHRSGIGVILDFVPAHFPTDAWNFGRFPRIALYTPIDPCKRQYPVIDTYISNYCRNVAGTCLSAS